MDTDRLRQAADDIIGRGRIAFADVRRLRRDILPDGISSREEAEILIRLDQDTSRSDRAWTEFFVSELVDFVVWAERPTGIVDEEAAKWLSDALERGRATRSCRALVHAIVREAERVHESLSAGAPCDVEILAVPAEQAAAVLAA
jgi:hypothetical protein